MKQLVAVLLLTCTFIAPAMAVEVVIPLAQPQTQVINAIRVDSVMVTNTHAQVEYSLGYYLDNGEFTAIEENKTVHLYGEQYNLFSQSIDFEQIAQALGQILDV